MSIKVTLDEINILVSEPSKEICSPQYGSVSCNLLRVWKEKDGRRNIHPSLHDCLSWNINLLSFALLALRPLLFSQSIPPALLALQLADGRSWRFSDSIIPYNRSIYLSVLFLQRTLTNKPPLNILLTKECFNSESDFVHMLVSKIS